MAAQQGLPVGVPTPMAVAPIGHGWHQPRPQAPEERVKLSIYVRPVYPATGARDLREARRLKQITQQQLAEQMGLTCGSSVHNWESGKAWPTSQNLIRLAHALDVPLATVAQWFNA